NRFGIISLTVFLCLAENGFKHSSEMPSAETLFAILLLVSLPDEFLSLFAIADFPQILSFAHFRQNFADDRSSSYTQNSHDISSVDESRQVFLCIYKDVVAIQNVKQLLLKQLAAFLESRSTSGSKVRQSQQNQGRDQLADRSIKSVDRPFGGRTLMEQLSW